MTSRERWTVYPLLFLALGLAVRSIVAPSGEFLAASVAELECGRLSCEEVVVVDQNGTVLVHIGREAALDGSTEGVGGGRIDLNDQNGELTHWISGSREVGASEGARDSEDALGSDGARASDGALDGGGAPDGGDAETVDGDQAKESAESDENAPSSADTAE